MPPPATSEWLLQVLGPYPASKHVFSDVCVLLDAVSTLSPRTDTYTYDDGRTCLLLCLSGTIPVPFRSQTYHFPVALWVPREYPREPPITYVVPAPHMVVRQSASVLPSGLVVTSYMQQWTRKWEGCSIISLVESLQNLFSTEPPLYAKPQSPSHSQSQSPNPQRMPSAQRPPPPPPPPARPPPPPTCSPSQTQDGSESNIPPPRPPKPSEVTASQDSPPSFSSNHSHVTPPIPPIPPLPSSSSSSFQSHTQPSSEINRDSSLPRSKPVPVPNLLDADADLQETIKVVDTARPPRPPNPELQALHNTLAARLATSYRLEKERLNAEAEQLDMLANDLSRGRAALDDEEGRLRAVKEVCDQVAQRYEAVVNAAQANINSVRQREDVHVDEIVCSTTVASNQLWDVVAEDSAIEDTISHLSRGLNGELARIDLDRFLKRVRTLAQEQFVKRALANKILAGMNGR